MNYLKIKIRQFLPAYLLISLCLIIIYTFLHWLFIVHLGLFRLSDDVKEFFIPLSLPWIPLIIWMRPRLKLLNFNTSGRKDPVAGIIMFSGFTMIASLVIAQQYMITATGKLSRLNYISEIRHTAPTKYYTAEHYYIAKKLTHFFTFYSVSGKQHQNFDIDLYCAVPVFDNLFPDTNMMIRLRDRLAAQGLVIINGKLQTMAYLKKLPADSIRAMRYLNPTLVMPQYGKSGRYGALAVMTAGYKLKDTMLKMKITPIAWLAFKFSQTISNSASLAEKNAAIQAQYSYRRASFMGAQNNSFTYLNRISYGDQKHYLAAIRYGNNVDDAFPTILYPVYDTYANKNGNKAVVFFWINAVGLLLTLLILAACRAHPAAAIREDDLVN